MKLVIAFLLLAVSMGYGQLPESNNIDITGDAAINVAPDRVRTDFGVETRNKVLDTAIAQNDAIVRRVIAAVRDCRIDEGDIQTDSIHVEMAYDSHDGTVVDYYQVTKSVQVFLRDVSKFEPLLTTTCSLYTQYAVGFLAAEAEALPDTLDLFRDWLERNNPGREPAGDEEAFQFRRQWQRAPAALSFGLAVWENQPPFLLSSPPLAREVAHI
jgi:hypothetical protein